MTDEQQFLTSAMPNILAASLGRICLETAHIGPAKCGDDIDRGLILQKLLAAHGFHLIYISEHSP